MSVEIRIISGIDCGDSSDFALLRQVRFESLRRPLGMPFDSTLFPGDTCEGSVHFLGVFAHRAIACATVIRSTFSDAGHAEMVFQSPAGEFQLRGMAVLEDFRGGGVGKQLLDAVHRWADSQSRSLWCHARLSAVPFYSRCGWQICSKTFDIPPIGAHVVMQRSNPAV